VHGIAYTFLNNVILIVLFLLCCGLQAASRGSLANNSSSVFSPTFAAQRAVNLSSKAHKQADIPELTTDWGSICAELARNAARGTQWPQQSKEVLQRVNNLMGGRWLLVESGKYTAPEHPRVGKPARALVHVAMFYAQEPQQDKAGFHDGFESRSSSKGRRSRGKHSVVPLIHTMKEPIKLSQLPEGSKSMWMPATYELDDSGWPTGEIGFKARSTAHNSMQATASSRLLLLGPSSSFQSCCNKVQVCGETTVLRMPCATPSR
jgi:hypothetical protein